MFKINNKDTRTTPVIVLVSSLLTLNIFHTLFIVNFELVIAGWGVLNGPLQNSLEILFKICLNFQQIKRINSPQSPPESITKPKK